MRILRQGFGQEVFHPFVKTEELQDIYKLENISLGAKNRNS
jgi:hypothetical protein